MRAPGMQPVPVEVRVKVLPGLIPYHCNRECPWQISSLNCLLFQKEREQHENLSHVYYRLPACIDAESEAKKEDAITTENNSTNDWRKSSHCIEQLSQLICTTWDGDLISKTDRDYLVESGLADRAKGFNFLTEKGVRLLVSMGLLKNRCKTPETRGHYNRGKIECIDVLEQLAADGEDFRILNAIEYLWRHRHKNGHKDVKKAIDYQIRYLTGEWSKYNGDPIKEAVNAPIEDNVPVEL